MKAKKNPPNLRARAKRSCATAPPLCVLAWFSVQAPTGKLTEIAAAEVLELSGARRAAEGRVVSSIARRPERRHPTLSRDGEDQPEDRQRIFLIDSGANMMTARPTSRARSRRQADAEMRDRFTRVLKGHIAIARAIFPKGALARKSTPSRVFPYGERSRFRPRHRARVGLPVRA